MLAIPVVSDTPSQLVAEVKRNFNDLMFVLANITAQVTATTITATEGFVALNTAFVNGVDADISAINGGANNYTGTGLAVVVVQSLPKVARGPHRNIKVVTSSDV